MDIKKAEIVKLQNAVNEYHSSEYLLTQAEVRFYDATAKLNALVKEQKKILDYPLVINIEGQRFFIGENERTGNINVEKVGEII